MFALFLILTSTLIAGCASTTHYSERPQNVTVSPDAAWTELLKGNERFIAGEKAPRDWNALRKHHAAGQWPFASIVSCSDSRVAPEVIFDQGMGDIFIVRTAGNTVAELALGSLEFSVNVLKTPLVVILGHEGCGAVYATVDAIEGILELPEGYTPDTLLDIVKEVTPAAEQAIATNKTGSELREYATTLHAKHVAQEILTSASGVQGTVERNEVMVIGAKIMFDGTITELFRVTGDNLNEFMSTSSHVKK